MAIKRYEVTVTSKHPAYGEIPGTLEVLATTAQEAVSMARKEMKRRGHDRHDGPVVYSARRA